MPTIAEVREKFPQYQDMSDEQLAGALHKKFYADLPIEEFNTKIGLGAPDAGHNVPEYVPPGVEGYNKETGLVEHTSMNDKVGAFVTGANDLPVIGPVMKAATSAAASAAVTPFSDKTFAENYKQMRARQEQVIRDNPGTALAGNIVGSTAVLAPIGATATGAKALGLSGSLPSRIGYSAASGGAISGTDAAVRGGDVEDVVGSTLIGASVGGAIPAVGAAVKGGYSAVKDKVGSVVRGALNPEAEAGRRVASAIKIDKASPAGVLDATDLATAAKNNQPLMNADLGGEQTRALARAAANQSPEARGAMERVVSDRFAGQGNRVTRLVSRLTGGKTDDLLMIDGLKDAASAANKPAYSRAFAQPAAQDMWHSGLSQLMQAPAMQEAAIGATKRGANRAAVDGFQAVKNPFTQVNGKFVLRVNQDGSIAKPTLQFWDQVKRNLDSNIGLAKRGGDNVLAGDLMALKNKLVSNLDQAVPSYKAARQGAASFFGAEDAVEAGKMFAKSSKSLPEFNRGIRAMKPAEREAFETGFASELIDMAKAAGDRTNVVNRLFKSQESREKMVMAFGKDRAQEIEAFVRVETAMDALRGAFGNSTTARQLIESGVIGGGTWWYTGDFNKGIAAAALSSGARMAGKKIDGNVMTQTAKMLLSDDPAMIARAVQKAAISPQRMAAVDALMKAAALAARSSNVVATPQMVVN
ncbi:hypothetical protein J1C56_02135 [Aminobacter anthyllidis]|uniref:Uncharacterized protein n=1 Tax=Aminobacter anthyllidis TaxID=1035067 RepID=A0A9X1D457_9HYPH|nr:hypothetical protein [Aminobacter anthyllidis]MBT1154384.1 hypothetical protein [Aminobacter anthyllidis]